MEREPADRMSVWLLRQSRDMEGKGGNDRIGNKRTEEQTNGRVVLKWCLFKERYSQMTLQCFTP